MPNHLTCWLILLSPFLRATAQTASPAAPATLHDRLVTAAQLSSLDDPDLKPWHLKLDVTVFDAKGKDPRSGTIETWHEGKNKKTVVTFGESSSTVLYNTDGTYEAHRGPDTPALSDAVLNAFLNPGPSVYDIDSAQLEERKEPFGKVKLDCIMLSRPIRDLDKAPIGLFPTYCLDQQGLTLRASYNFGSQTVLRNGLGTFQAHQVATLLSLYLSEAKVAEAKVTIFTTFTPSSDFFKADSTLTPVRGTYALISGGVMAGDILTKAEPVYPVSAKQKGIGGTVVLRAIIGRDGHIYSLRAMSGPDPDLTIAAIAAVRKWTYKPYLLNGVPTEVDTTITVNFNLNYH